MKYLGEEFQKRKLQHEEEVEKLAKYENVIVKIA